MYGLEKTCIHPDKKSRSDGGSLVARGKGIPRKTIGESIKNDLGAVICLIDIIYDGTSWSHLIYVASPT